MSKGLWFYAFAIAAAGFGGNAAAQDVPSAAQLVWRDFRNTQYLHSDIVGVTSPGANGQRVLIIAEPSQRLTLAQLKKYLAPYATTVGVMTHPVMHEGSVSDVVATLKPGLGEPEMRALTILLSEVLQGNEKGARLTQLPVAAPRISGASLDLKVNAEELRGFLFSEQQLFESGVLQPRAVFSSLLKGKSRGVYRTQSSPGFVVWGLARDADISKLSDQVREFALRGDLILGSVADRDSVFIVARLRQETLQRLPALRNDTIQLLASVNAKNISQSYERTMWASGKGSDSFDRAPIYLSAELRDTEYGSLLNIVDQLLKGWSEAGQVAYMDFRYPKPRTYPFGAVRASSEPGSAAFLFNWNTEGVFYSLQADGVEVTALNRTGSLPVIYGSRTNRRTAKEAVGYDYFATSGDANIARVLQYASVYAIFKRYGVSSNWLTRFKVEDDAATAVLIRCSQTTVLFLLDMHGNVPKWKAFHDDVLADPHFRAEGPLVQRAFDELASLPADRQANEVSLYAEILGDPRGKRVNLARRAIEVLNDPSSSPSARTAAAHSKAILERVAAIERVLSETGIGAEFAGELKLWDAMSKAGERQGLGWIQTAPVVASKNAGAALVGGHNIDASMVTLRSDASLRPGKVLASMDPSGEITITHSAADRARVGALSRAVSQMEGKTVNEAVEELERVLQSTPVKTRSLAEALSPEGAQLSSKAEYKLALAADDDIVRSTSTAPLSGQEKSLASAHRPTVFVRRLADRYEVRSTESDTTLEIGSAAALHQVLVEHARLGGLQSGQVRILMSGFEGKADGVVQSVRSRVARSSAAGPEEDAIFILNDSKDVDALVAKSPWAKAEIDTAGITSRVVTTGEFAGATELSIPFKVPAAAGRPSFLGRFFLYFKEAVSPAFRAQISAKVQAALRGFGDANMSLADCKARLHQLLVKDGLDRLVGLALQTSDITVSDAQPVDRKGQA